MDRLKKLASLAAVLLAAFFALKFVLRLFESDETRIRRRVAAIEAAFNDGAAGGVADALAPSFRERSSGLGRDEVRGLLFQFFQTSRDPKTRELVVAVRVETESVKIDLAGEKPTRARLALTAVFTRRSTSQPGPGVTARVEFRGQLEKLDGEWKFVEAEAKLVEGTWPGF